MVVLYICSEINAAQTFLSVVYIYIYIYMKMNKSVKKNRNISFILFMFWCPVKKNFEENIFKNAFKKF